MSYISGARLVENKQIMVRYLSAILLVSLPYTSILLLSEHTKALGMQIPMFMGGASAFYFVFQSKTRFSKLITLYSFLVSSFCLFLSNFVIERDIAIFIGISLSFSFFFSFFFCSGKISNDLFGAFLLILAARIFMSPEMLLWEISLVLELILLFWFRYIETKENNLLPLWVFVSFILLFILSASYLFYYQLVGYMNFLEMILLSAAGAGFLHFICLSKTKGGQSFGLCIYLINNILLGFFLRKEGETFPQVTLFFLALIICLFISLTLVAEIRKDSFSSILSESKTTLRGIFFPGLSLLTEYSLGNDYFLISPWLASLLIQIIVLLLLKFILKKEDEESLSLKKSTHGKYLAERWEGCRDPGRRDLPIMMD